MASAQGGETATRTLVLWAPDWPVVAAMSAADVPAHLPAAVADAHRVTAVSAPARALGVRRGMRLRAARGLCPDLAFLPVDDPRDARLFEPIAQAVETVVAGLEIARPGLLLLPADGAARFYGSEQALAERLLATVTEQTGHEVQVGIADGLLAAVLAAREHRLVPPGESRADLAGRPLADVVHIATSPERVSQMQDLVDLWDRLGLRRMGDLAHLAYTDVEARFGEPGAWAHRLVHGEDLRPPARRRIDADVASECVLDPPAYRIDIAAFAARRLAEDLYAMLVERNASCGRIAISARTESGRELTRTWRTDDGALGGLTAARMTDRVRWQLEGWMSQAGRAGAGEAQAQPPPDQEDPNAEQGEPLVWLGLEAQDLVPAGTHQGGLWGADSGSSLRAHRALERVQGLLGVEAVFSARLQGGRGVRDQVHLTPWDDAAPVDRSPDAPWPGRLPEPFPSSVLGQPEAVEVLDDARRPVVVDRRLQVSGAPHMVVRAGAGQGITSWAGPWPLSQRWWRPDGHRAVYVQAIIDDGSAWLLSCSQGQWFVEASYD